MVQFRVAIIVICAVEKPKRHNRFRGQIVLPAPAAECPAALPVRHPRPNASLRQLAAAATPLNDPDKVPHHAPAALSVVYQRRGLSRQAFIAPAARLCERCLGARRRCQLQRSCSCGPQGSRHLRLARGSGVRATTSRESRVRTQQGGENGKTGKRGVCGNRTGRNKPPGRLRRPRVNRYAILR
jgi:hypothetical protein